MSDNQHFYYLFRISLKKEERGNSYCIQEFSKLHELILLEIKEIAKQYCFQLECTEDDNYHYGGWVNLKERARISTMKREYSEIGDWYYYWQIVSNPKAACKYNMKTDTRVAGPWADKVTTEEKKQDDLNDKYAYLNNVEDIVLKETQLFDWQKKAKKDVLEQNDRHLLWIYDTRGGKGKTALLRHLVTYNDFGLISYGKANDILCSVADNPRPGYCVNLTKTKPKELGKEELYAALEGVKDGFFMSGKYKPKQVNRRPPKVIVVSNSPPDVSKLAVDRFIVTKI